MKRFLGLITLLAWGTTASLQATELDLSATEKGLWDELWTYRQLVKINLENKAAGWLNLWTDLEKEIAGGEYSGYISWTLRDKKVQLKIKEGAYESNSKALNPSRPQTAHDLFGGPSPSDQWAGFKAPKSAGTVMQTDPSWFFGDLFENEIRQNAGDQGGSTSPQASSVEVDYSSMPNDQAIEEMFKS